MDSSTAVALNFAFEELSHHAHGPIGEPGDRGATCDAKGRLFLCGDAAGAVFALACITVSPPTISHLHHNGRYDQLWDLGAGQRPHILAVRCGNCSGRRVAVDPHNYRQMDDHR
jgi:hypothetical protein